MSHNRTFCSNRMLHDHHIRFPTRLFRPTRCWRATCDSSTPIKWASATRSWASRKSASRCRRLGSCPKSTLTYGRINKQASALFLLRTFIENFYSRIDLLLHISPKGFTIGSPLSPSNTPTQFEIPTHTPLPTKNVWPLFQILLFPMGGRPKQFDASHHFCLWCIKLCVVHQTKPGIGYIF